jgi:hypothetical protein
MRVVVDRIEGKFAVCELDNSQMINIALKDIPFIPKEGDVLIIEDSIIKYDFEETKRRKAEIEELTKDFWE